MKNKVTTTLEAALPKSNLKTVIFVALGVLAVLVSLYVYFVGKIVFDVVGRRTAEASIRSSQSAISGLAVAYLKEIKQLDLAEAEMIGLSESRHTLYASRPATVSVGLAHEL